MHPLFSTADSITGEVISGAIEVHRDKGAGLVESIYERCLVHELGLRGFTTSQQEKVTITYKDLIFEETLRYDVLVNGCLLLELKAVEHVLPIHKAKLLSYMKLLDVPLGLLMNFHEPILTKAIHRLMLPNANRP